MTGHQDLIDRLTCIHSALSEALGDTDPSPIDDETDEELRERDPLFWAAKELALMMQEPSPAIGDVEKLIEQLETWNYADWNGGSQERPSVLMKEAAVMLRALAAEKYNYLEYENALAKKRDEIASLRAKLERARETFGNLFRIRYPKQRHARSCECEICVARATLEELK